MMQRKDFTVYDFLNGKWTIDQVTVCRLVRGEEVEALTWPSCQRGAQHSRHTDIDEACRNAVERYCQTMCEPLPWEAK